MFYPGTPKQAGPPLFAAVFLLPLLAPAGRRGAFLLAVGVVAFLAVLAAALNPACVPYALAAAAVAALVLGAARAGGPRAAALANRVGAGRRLHGRRRPAGRVRPLLRPDGAGPPAARRRPDPGRRLPRAGRGARLRPRAFSWPKAALGLASVNPLRLSPVESTTALVWDRAEPLRGWGERWPPAALALGTLALALFALAGLLPHRARAAAARDPLVRLLLAGLALWLGLKYSMTFWIAGLSRAGHHTGLLSVYGRYVLLRCELLLLFACLAAAIARLFLALEARSGRAARRAAAAGLAAGWLLPALGLAAGVLVGGFPVVPTTDRFAPTPDDLRLADWLADNVPPEKGNVVLAAFTFTAGPGDVERYVFPVKGGYALALRDPHHNFRFLLPCLEGDGMTNYRQHVLDALDAHWCRENGVRYFYANPEGLADNPGLAAAVEDGRLQPRHREGDSCVYELAEEAIP